MRALAGPLEQLQNTALRIGQLQVRVNHVAPCTARRYLPKHSRCKPIDQLLSLAAAHLVAGSEKGQFHVLQAEAKLPVEPEEFQESFKPFLMDVVFQWSKVRSSDA